VSLRPALAGKDHHCPSQQHKKCGNARCRGTHGGVTACTLRVQERIRISTGDPSAYQRVGQISARKNEERGQIAQAQADGRRLEKPIEYDGTGHQVVQHKVDPGPDRPQLLVAQQKREDDADNRHVDC
jgi:hypothetical protein